MDDIRTKDFSDLAKRMKKHFDNEIIGDTAPEDMVRLDVQVILEQIFESAAMQACHIIRMGKEPQQKVAAMFLVEACCKAAFDTVNADIERSLMADLGKVLAERIGGLELDELFPNTGGGDETPR